MEEITENNGTSEEKNEGLTPQQNEVTNENSQEDLSSDDSQKEDWKRYDWEFHLALIKACGSKNLLSLHAVLYDKYLRYQMLVLTYRGEEAVEEHRAVFEAALARDIDTAAQTLKTHIDKGLDHTLIAF